MKNQISNAEDQRPNDPALSQSSSACGWVKCPDCRGYGDHAYGDGLSWWNRTCETCNGRGKIKVPTSPNAKVSDAPDSAAPNRK